MLKLFSIYLKHLEMYLYENVCSLAEIKIYLGTLYFI